MKTIFMGLILVFFSGTAFAQLEPYEDFDTSDEVTVATYVKVAENMIPYYLEGISKTWVPAMKYSQEQGYVKSWNVMISDLPESGDFNVMLFITYKDDAAVRGSEEQYKKIDEYVRQNVLSDEESDEIVQNKYPNMRKIVGEYRVRNVTFKN